jgi:hypothetical protein
LKLIFEKSSFRRLQTDKGREFFNSNVKRLLEKTHTEGWISENDDVKPALVERFNRTLKDRMYKYFTSKNTKKWIDILPKLIRNYNNTVHPRKKICRSMRVRQNTLQTLHTLHTLHTLRCTRV